MNFYKHHMGDYARDTAHLTWDEDMAYTRLLRAYYGREGPIPDADRYRLTRASTKREREAVDRVLAEFFKHDGNGYWRQKRADHEVAAYQTQCQKNREVGKLGGRPRKTDEVTENNPSGLGVVGSCRNPNQNQIPEPDTRKDSIGNAPNGARHAIPDSSPIVITLPLREGGDFEVRSSLVAELEPLYPAVDVPTTLREMKAWLVGNPDRRKTKKGVRRFIANWLHSEQDKHGR